MISELQTSERLSGPCHGVFIGAYATQLDGIFYGYARLFTDAPADFWSSPVAMKLSAGAFDSELEAIEAAERKGVAAAEERTRTEFTGLWAWLLGRTTRQHQSD